MKRSFARLVGGALLATAAPVLAQEAPAAAPPAPPALQPALVGPLTWNPSPVSFDVAGSKIYVTAAGSGLLSTQSNHVPGDDASFADVANAQLMIQKVDGVFQFFAQAGLYSFPSIGYPYLKATTATDNLFGVVPQAWVKIAPTDNFNIQAGLLPTLIGAELVYSYQNMNIERGLLWGQENIINRGVQANLTLGKLALSVALTDGFFSGKWNWVVGSAAYTIDSSNTIAFVAGGSTKKSLKSSFATSPIYNNSSIYNVIYTYSSGKWMVQPYFQYTHVPTIDFGGGFVTDTANTWGVALLTKYAVTDNFTLPVRLEYISTDGASKPNAPNLLYGQGSKAFTFTITPTYTIGRAFVRAEFNWAAASDITPGFAFGDFGTNKSQVRGLLEAGFLF